MKPLPTEKECPMCGVVKPAANYYVVRDKHLYPYCKPCNAQRNRNWIRKNRERHTRYHREYHRKNSVRHLHGLSPDEVRLLPVSCAICGVGDGKKKLAIDHDHKSQTFRGRLCFRCNAAIGLFRDDPVLLAKAVQYLAGEIGR